MQSSLLILPRGIFGIFFLSSSVKLSLRLSSSHPVPLVHESIYLNFREMCWWDGLDISVLCIGDPSIAPTPSVLMVANVYRFIVLNSERLYFDGTDDFILFFVSDGYELSPTSCGDGSPSFPGAGDI